MTESFNLDLKRPYEEAYKYSDFDNFTQVHRKKAMMRKLGIKTKEKQLEKKKEKYIQRISKRIEERRKLREESEILTSMDGRSPSMSLHHKKVYKKDSLPSVIDSKRGKLFTFENEEGDRITVAKQDREMITQLHEKSKLLRKIRNAASTEIGYQSPTVMSIVKNVYCRYGDDRKFKFD